MEQNAVLFEARLQAEVTTEIAQDATSAGKPTVKDADLDRLARKALHEKFSESK